MLKKLVKDIFFLFCTLYYFFYTEGFSLFAVQNVIDLNEYNISLETSKGDLFRSFSKYYSNGNIEVILPFSNFNSLSLFQKLPESVDDMILLVKKDKRLPFGFKSSLEIGSSFFEMQMDIFDDFKKLKIKHKFSFFSTYYEVKDDSLDSKIGLEFNIVF